MVVVDESETCVGASALDACKLAYILEGSILLVMKEHNATVKTHCQIRCTVIVIVSGRTSVAADCGIKTRFLGYIFKSATPQVTEKTHSTLWTVIRNE